MPPKNRITVPCAHCGKTIDRPPSAVKNRKHCFCDQTCHMAFKSAQGTAQIPCFQCGNILTRNSWRLQKNKHHFCNRACERTFKAGRPIPSRERKVEMTCAYCGTKFMRKQCRGNHQHVYCDRNCHAKHLRELRKGQANPAHSSILRHCAQCGAEHSVIGSRAAKYKRHFCSKDCYMAWQSTKLSGPDNPRWTSGKGSPYGPNWTSQRRKTRKRDGYKCQACGISEKKYGRQMDVHHIVPFQSFGIERYEEANVLTNLITLCPSCHRSAEHERIPIQPNLL